MRRAPWPTLLVIVAACLGDPVGPGILTLSTEGAAVDTVWVGAPGEALPSVIRLRVTDDAGRPLPGASVTWEAEGRNAHVLAPTAQSNAAGLATAGWLLGTDAAEEQRLHVSVQTSGHESEVVIRARAVPHVASQIRVLIDTPAVVRLGDTLPVTVNAIDPYGNLFPAPDVTLSVTDSAIGAVAGQAFIAGPHRGATRIGVASHGLEATLPVRVTQYVAAIVPVSDTLRFSALGAQRLVAYVVRDDRGRVVADTTVKIAVADSSVAQLTGEYVRAVAPGLTTLSLTLAPAAATIPVAVQQRVGSLQLVRDTIRLDALTDTTTVNPVVRDSLGSPIPEPALEYSISDAKVAKFYSHRTLEAVMPGSAVVTVRDPGTGIATSAPVVVRQVITRIDLAPSQISFDALGDTLTLGATALDRLGFVVADAALEFSVGDAQVAVFASGSQLRSVSLGQTLVVVSDPETGIVATTDVQVGQRVTRLNLTTDSIVFDALGDTVPLGFAAWDRLGATATSATATYASSDPSIVTVTPDGLVRSRQAGSAIVVGQSPDGPADTVYVTVAQRVTAIVLGRDSLLFESLGAVQAVDATALDRLGSPVSNAQFTYAIEDTSIAILASGAEVRAVANGGTLLLVAKDEATATVDLRVAQRPVRVAVPSDTIHFEALGDTQTVVGVALDSLGSPVAGTVTSVVVSDTAIAATLDSVTLRALENGTTSASFVVAGVARQVVVAVQQIATTLTAAVTFGKPIVTLPVGAAIPFLCQAFDRNGFLVSTGAGPALSPRVSGTVEGSGCTDARVRRSGYDTLRFSMGSAEARVPVIVAAASSVTPPTAEYAFIDSMPTGTSQWAPTLRRNSQGEFEVYVTGYSGDTTGFSQGHLQRFVSSDGLHFSYDGVALSHNDNICHPDGQGIESIAIVPRVDSVGWRMFYAAGSFKCYGWQVFSAVSLDERKWTKEPGVRISNGGTLPPQAPIDPPWPAGEGIDVYRLPSGEWQMLVGTREHLTPPEDKFAITEWRSFDQLSWTYMGPVLTARDMPPGLQGGVYAPTLREIVPGLWRMLFTAENRGTSPVFRSEIWSAVSTDRQHWQVEGSVLGSDQSRFLYTTLVSDLLITLRWDVGQEQRFARATVVMP